MSLTNTEEGVLINTVLEDLSHHIKSKSPHVRLRVSKLEYKFQFKNYLLIVRLTSSVLKSGRKSGVYLEKSGIEIGHVSLRLIDNLEVLFYASEALSPSYFPKTAESLILFCESAFNSSSQAMDELDVYLYIAKDRRKALEDIIYDLESSFISSDIWSSTVEPMVAKLRIISKMIITKKNAPKKSKFLTSDSAEEWRERNRSKRTPWGEAVVLHNPEGDGSRHVIVFRDKIYDLSGLKTLSIGLGVTSERLAKGIGIPFPSHISDIKSISKDPRSAKSGGAELLASMGIRVKDDIGYRPHTSNLEEIEEYDLKFNPREQKSGNASRLFIAGLVGYGIAKMK